MAVKLRLVMHGHNRGNERSRDKHTLAHCRQMEEIAIVEAQLGVSQLVSCRRAPNCDFVDVSRTWVFSIGCCPHSSGSQIFTLIVSVYSTVCVLKDSTGTVCSVQP